jgi:hypothetical protein
MNDMPLVGTAGIDYDIDDKAIQRWKLYPSYAIPDTVYLEGLIIDLSHSLKLKYLQWLIFQLIFPTSNNTSIDSCPHKCPSGKYSKSGDGFWYTMT